MLKSSRGVIVDMKVWLQRPNLARAIQTRPLVARSKERRALQDTDGYFAFLVIEHLRWCQSQTAQRHESIQAQTREQGDGSAKWRLERCHGNTRAGRCCLPNHSLSLRDRWKGYELLF